MGTGSITSYDVLGNTPRPVVLSFTPPTTTGLQWIEIFKKVGATETFLERERVVDRVAGHYPYWYMLQHSEADTTYVVDYRTSTNAFALGANNRLTGEAYVPPMAISQEVYVNAGPYVKELTRRQYTVLETMGEQAILLRRRTSGTRCRCVHDEARHANARCKDCYGVGWEGGWDVFHPFLFDFNLAGERLQLTETAIALDQTPRAWTTIVPELRGGDMVIRKHGQLLDRFEVTNPTRSQRDGVGAVPTIQEFSVKVHNQGHPVYEFPVENTVTSYTKPTSHVGLGEAGI